MRKTTAVLISLALLVALAIGWQAPQQAMAQTANRASSRSSGSLNLGVTNAAITSTVAAGDVLVIRAMTATSNAAGNLVITNGSSGVELFRLYLAANTPTTVPVDVFGSAGVRCSRGTTPYANAISSGTAVSIQMSVTLE